MRRTEGGRRTCRRAGGRRGAPEGGDCSRRQRPALGQVSREGEGLWARRGGPARRLRADRGGSAMAPCGCCWWALLLAWLPAGEWGRAGAAVSAGSRPPAGASPLSGTTRRHREPGPGRRPRVFPGVNVVRCGGSGGGPAARGRGGTARASVAPSRCPSPPGGRAELSRARHESHAERSFVIPKVRPAALLGGSGRLLPGSLQYHSWAASLVWTRAQGYKHGGAPLWLLASTNPSLCCSLSSPSLFGDLL